MNKYSEITPEIYNLADMIKRNCVINPELYQNMMLSVACVT